jgi:hypothetical protein
MIVKHYQMEAFTPGLSKFPFGLKQLFKSLLKLWAGHTNKLWLETLWNLLDLE